ncbi:hypothetical protein K438DRAFT_1802611 [Mycena galopus ATCC 62051]|nr:hypothetical protein K438DRAFT_1802611 [Mycena galopus ATCC 62051]
MSYPFILSQRSISQQRDMFLFSFFQYPYVLMSGGWNLARHGMTVQKFYRWLDIIDDHSLDRNINFQLRKINVTRSDILTYVVASAEGPMLRRDSVELLEPGVYGPFLDGKPYRGKVGDNPPLYTFREWERGPGRRGEDITIDMNRENRMPQAIIDAVARRDRGVCCVTGRADLPTSITWAFLPALAYESYQDRDFGKEGLHEAYRTVENAITLCTQLLEPFMENMFSVDIEPHRCLRRSPQQSPPLPLNLRRQSASSEFWHLHFKWTLYGNVDDPRRGIVFWDPDYPFTVSLSPAAHPAIF